MNKDCVDLSHNCGFFICSRDNEKKIQMEIFLGPMFCILKLAEVCQQWESPPSHLVRVN